MDLECLGLYWNCGDGRISDLSNEAKKNFLALNVAKRGFHPDNFHFGIILL